jgi:hypothetical protein
MAKTNINIGGEMMSKKASKLKNVMVIPLIWVVFRVVSVLMLAWGYYSTSNQDFLIALGFFLVIVILIEIHSRLTEVICELKGVEWLK